MAELMLDRKFVKARLHEAEREAGIGWDSPGLQEAMVYREAARAILNQHGAEFDAAKAIIRQFVETADKEADRRAAAFRRT